MPSPRKSYRLKVKALATAAASEAEPLPPVLVPPKCKLSSREKAQLYREKRKQDPERYAAYLEKNKQACSKYRAQMTAEKKAEYLQNGKLRSRKSREKKKEEKEMRPEKRVTRKDDADREAERAKWREEKRKQRQTMHWKTREAINAKRRAAYHAKKNKSQQASSVFHSDQLSQSPSVCDVRTPAAQRKALQRAKKAMPSSPMKYVHTVQALINSASPRKKKLFTENGMDKPVHEIGSKFAEAVQRLRNKKCAGDRQTRRVLLSVVNGTKLSSDAAMLMNVNRKTLKRHLFHKKRPQLVKNESRNTAAAEFFEESAMAVPDKKLVSKKTGKSASFLRKSLKELHREYESTGRSVSFSSFAKCRPSNIRLMAQAKWRQCLCEYCTNVTLKLDTVKAVATRYGLHQCTIANERAAVGLITCDAQKKDCCYGTCDQCCADQLDQHLQPLLQHHGDPVKWYRWENQARFVRGKQASSFSICCIKTSNFMPKIWFYLSA